MKPKSAADVLPFLPAAVRRRVEELVATLRKVLGDELVSVVLHGAAVRGGAAHDPHTVELVVVLKHDAAHHLERIGGALRIARAAARIDCTLLVADEIARAADVFPLLFEDIQQHHAPLYGDDPFAALVIQREHRRLRIEQELREARMALRRMMAEDDLAGEALADCINRKLHRLRLPLAALLTLHGKARHDDIDRLLLGCAAHFSLNVDALYAPVRDPQAALAALKALLDLAVHDVDKLDLAATSAS